MASVVLNRRRPQFAGSSRIVQAYPSPDQGARMSFQEAVVACLTKCSAFSGRARRSGHWGFGLDYFGVLFIVALVSPATARASQASQSLLILRQARLSVSLLSAPTTPAGRARRTHRASARAR